MDSETPKPPHPPESVTEAPIVTEVATTEASPPNPSRRTFLKKIGGFVGAAFLAPFATAPKPAQGYVSQGAEELRPTEGVPLDQQLKEVEEYKKTDPMNMSEGSSNPNPVETSPTTIPPKAEGRLPGSEILITDPSVDKNEVFGEKPVPTPTDPTKTTP